MNRRIGRRMLYLALALAWPLSAEGMDHILTSGQAKSFSVRLRNPCRTPQHFDLSLPPDAPWLRLVGPSRIAVPGGESRPVELRIDSAGLGVGHYGTALRIACPACAARCKVRQPLLPIRLKVIWPAAMLEPWEQEGDTDSLFAREIVAVLASMSRAELRDLLRDWRGRLHEAGRHSLTLGERELLMLRLSIVDPAQSIGQAIASLQTQPAVLWAQPNFRYLTADSARGDLSARQWHLAPIGAPVAHATLRGRGIRVAVIDSGIDRRHPDLRGRVRLSKRFTQKKDPGRHGTAVAGILAAADDGKGILGVAPAATLLSIKACWEISRESGAAECSTFTLAQGLGFAATAGAQIINLSLTGREDPMIRQLIRWLRQRGILVVAAAGNTGPRGQAAFPAAYAEVLAVTASGSQGELLPTAAHGPAVDLAAPGEDILAPVPGGGFRELTGTSYATPQVSAAAALLLEAYPKLDPAALSAVLRGDGGASTATTPPLLDIPQALGRARDHSQILPPHARHRRPGATPPEATFGSRPHL